MITTEVTEECTKKQNILDTQALYLLRVLRSRVSVCVFVLSLSQGNQ